MTKDAILTLWIAGAGVFVNVITIIVNCFIAHKNKRFSQDHQKNIAEYDTRYEMYKILVLDKLKTVLLFAPDCKKEIDKFYKQANDTDNIEQKKQICISSITAIDEIQKKIYQDVYPLVEAYSESLLKELDKEIQNYADATQSVLNDFIVKDCNLSNIEKSLEKFKKQRRRYLKQVVKSVKKVKPKF